MSDLDDRILREFLLESLENLERLEQDLVALERAPGSRERLASAFRTLHTLKGTCGFLGFSRLEAVSHRGESLLMRLRDGELVMTAEIADVLLAVVDAARSALAAIERTGAEGEADDSALLRALDQAGAAPRPGPAQDAAAGQEPSLSAAALPPRAAIRVDVPLLERLGNDVGELVLARNQILRLAGSAAPLRVAAQRLDDVTSALQEGILQARMQPLQVLWDTLPRIVRDAASACGKQVLLDARGGQTELDKTLLEALRDPLVHLVRNAVDHGIEPPAERVAAGKPPEGSLLVRASQRGGQVQVEIADDGAGISWERIREHALREGIVSPAEAERWGETEWLALLFRPGFSTAGRVTRISGRGVGLDVARTSLERIGGALAIETRPGLGTSFRLRIPLTLAILPCLGVTSGGVEYALPLAGVTEVARLGPGPGVEWIQELAVHRLRGELLPVVFLAQVLGERPSPSRAETEGAEAERPGPPVVVVQVEGRRYCLVVDDIGVTSEAVVKPLGPLPSSRMPFAGATVGGQGRVCLILDLLAIAQAAGVPERKSESGTVARPAPPAETFVLLEPAPGSRAVVPVGSVERIEGVEEGRILRLGARRALVEEGKVLPLVSYAEIAGGPLASLESECLVVRSPHGPVGLLVSRILDVVQVPTSDSAASAKGPTGAVVVRGEPAERLDPARLVEDAAARDLVLRVPGLESA